MQLTSGTTTSFAWDGENMIAEYNGSSLTDRYVFGPNMDEPIVAYDASGNRSWLYADERGSIVASANSSAGVLYTDRYDEYGAPPLDGGGNNLNSGRFQYTGQMWLPQIGVYYYKARMYSPTLGRFMQTDPIGYNGDGPNLYAYVLNDPINYGDPLGLATSQEPVHYECNGDICAIVVPGPTGGVGLGPSPQPGTGGGGGGGGGGANSGGKKQAKKAPTPNQCRLESLKLNGAALTADLLGIIAEGMLPEGSAAAVILTSFAGVVGFGASVAHEDLKGIGVTYGGRTAGMAEGFTAGRIFSIVKAASIITLAASTYRDIQKASQDYQNCLAGRG